MWTSLSKATSPVNFYEDAISSFYVRLLTDGQLDARGIPSGILQAERRTAYSLEIWQYDQIVQTALNKYSTVRMCFYFLTVKRHQAAARTVAQLAESQSLAGELTLSCARPSADG